MGDTRWGLGIQIIFISIISVLILTDTCLGARNITCSRKERLALIKFKNSVKDKYGMLSSWVGDDCCQWESVTCDESFGNVVGLYLRGYSSDSFSNAEFDEVYGLDTYLWGPPVVYRKENYLVGDNLDSSLRELMQLEYLDLSGNDFGASLIPKFIGTFERLSYLNLSNAGFSGLIPFHIGNLSSLKVLDVSKTYPPFIVEDMAWVSGLWSLEHLILNDVDLSGAQKVDRLLYIPSLLKLSLSSCRLSNADISPQINSSTKLANIKHLDLSHNYFQGEIPAFLQNMTSLAFLDLSGSNLSLARDFASMLNMISFVSELHLSQCELQKINISPTHQNFSRHSNIKHLDLSLNEIEGRFPSFLTNMTSLLSLDLSENYLNSTVPVMPNLLKLDLSFNMLEHVGIWRQCHLKELIVLNNQLEEEMVGSTTNVSECSQYAFERLYLSRNYLNGSLLESLGRLTNLRDLDLSDNNLAGPVPEALGKLRLLESLDLSRNHLIGSIPDFLGNPSKLYLDHNQFNGSIPESLGSLTRLKELLLQSNRLTGPIPTSFGKLSRLNYLDVSNNSLTEIVSEAHFANLSVLKYLNTAYNNKLTFNISREWVPPFQLRIAHLGSCNLSDEFPDWFRTQRNLEVLVLSNASIFGPLPTWLQKMPIIRVLDLSHNKLTGPLTSLPSGDPSGRIKNYTIGLILVQNNLFSGSIPKSLCTRIDLEVLDLSGNELSGNIPSV